MRGNSRFFSFPRSLAPTASYPGACDPEGAELCLKLEERAWGRGQGNPHPRCLFPLSSGLAATQGSAVTQTAALWQEDQREEARDAGRPRGSTGSRGLSPAAQGRPDPKQLTRLWWWNCGGTTAKAQSGQGAAHAQDRLTQHSKGYERGPPNPGRLCGTCDLNPTGSMPSKMKTSTCSTESINKTKNQIMKKYKVQPRVTQQTE